jgi:dTDP-4-amino-4,6-dideoxygalactose transaminase
VNSANHALYRRCLAGVPGVRVAEYDEREHCNYGYVIVEVDEREAGASRDELMELLWSENVLARRYFYPGCHRMEPYRSLLAQSPPSLPVTEWLCERVLALPTGTVVGSLEVAKICDFIRTTLGRESTGGRQSRLRVISP